MNTPAPELHWFFKMAREHFGKLVLTAAVPAAVTLAHPHIKTLQSLAAVPQSIEHLEAEMVKVRDDIEALRRPHEIFEVGRSSRAAEGFCVAGQPCEMILILRRTPEGVLCRIVPGQTLYVFYSADQLLRREVSRSDQPSSPPRNLGTDWSEVHVSVLTPTDFPVSSGFAIVPLYAHCGGPEDEGEVRQESVVIPVEIVPRRPAPAVPTLE